MESLAQREPLGTSSPRAFLLPWSTQQNSGTKTHSQMGWDQIPQGDEAVKIRDGFSFYYETLKIYLSKSK